MKNKPRKSLIPKNAAATPQLIYLNKDVSVLEKISQSGSNDVPVFISIKYIQHKHECFSEWSKVEMDAFWSFNTNVHNKTWQQVYQSGGKGDKTGLGYTVIDKQVYPESELKNKLSDDITLFELRVTQRIRVHGFRMGAIFFICWLDKNHSLLGK